MTTLREAAQQALWALLTFPHDISDEMFAAIAALKAALSQEQARPTVKESLQVEPAATTQQPVGDTPPSDYRRGYWDGFAIGKREGRIEAEDALSQSVQEPVAWYQELGSEVITEHPDSWGRSDEPWIPLYTAPPPPQRKPLSLTDLQEALVLTNLIDRDAIDDPDNYDDGSTLSQIDELYRIIKEQP